MKHFISSLTFVFYFAGVTYVFANFQLYGSSPFAVNDRDYILTCNIGTENLITITWRKNGTTVAFIAMSNCAVYDPGNNASRNYNYNCTNNRTYNLIIPADKISAENGTTWTCENSGGGNRADYKVIVYHNFSLTLQLHGPAYGFINQRYIFNCTVTGGDDIAFFLQNENANPKRVGVIQKINGDCHDALHGGVCNTTCACEIGKWYSWTVRVNAELHGTTWTCESHTEPRVKSNEWILNVAIYVTSVRLEGVLGRTLPVIADETKTLICVTGESRPRAYISWYIGNTNYTNSSKSILISGQDGMTSVKSVLTFTPKEEQNNLEINCMAYNYDSDAAVGLNTKPTLDVQYSPRLFNSTKTDVFRSMHEHLKLTAIFVANPEPNISWFFQMDSHNSKKKILNGTFTYKDPEHYLTNFLKTISSEREFGKYFVRASNNIGTTEHVFKVHRKGLPSAPTSFEAYGGSDTMVLLQWQSNFDGGSTQTFSLSYTSLVEFGSWTYLRSSITDTGGGKYHAKLVSGLVPDTHYLFALYAGNLFGNSSTVYVNHTTMGSDQSSGQSMFLAGVVLSVVGSIFILVGAGLVVFYFVKTLRSRNHTTSSESSYCDLGDKRDKVNVYDTCADIGLESSTRSEQNYENEVFEEGITG